MSKLVYVLGGNYGANGMANIITQKMNWLAEHTDWTIIALLTESARGRAFFYPMHPAIRVVNFALDFDDLDILPPLQKMLRYRKKQNEYKHKFAQLLQEEHPDVVVSAMRREINFLTDLRDGSKKVGELHFCRQTYRVFSHRWVPAFVSQWITRLWQQQLVNKIKQLDAFVVLTEEDKRAWAELNDVRVIPNFISELPPVVSTLSNKQVLAVGRYTWQKGFDDLLRAWQRVEAHDKEWTLHIYGAGDRTVYEQLALELGLLRVQLHGTAPDMNEVYAQSSLFAFSSRYEGFGMVLIEAMACGVPPVSFACPCGPSDIITDGVDGYLVSPGDTDALAGKLLYLMQHPEKRIAMGAEARRQMSRFVREDVMRRWKALLEEIILKERWV